jgi:hypothetical protein
LHGDEELSLKPQNYALVAIDPGRSLAKFVTHFLNSELGRQVREAYKAGATIPRLNSQGLKELPIFVPDLQTQHEMIEVEEKIMAEEGIVLGLQNELTTLRRQLWADPSRRQEIDGNLQKFAKQLTASPRQSANEGLEQWSLWPLSSDPGRRLEVMISNRNMSICCIFSKQQRSFAELFF